MNTENYVIIDIIPGRAAAETLTPDRRFLQVVFRHEPPNGFLTTKRIISRNFWEEAFNVEREDGVVLNIDADQLFLSICERCGITAENINDITWEPGSKQFEQVLGQRVKAQIVSHYVEPYTIPGAASKLATRFTYTAIVLDGEDEFNVFRTQGHVVIQDPDEIAAVQKQLQEIASINERARETRQAARGVAPPNERTGTGAITSERSLSGKHSSDGFDPALTRDPERKKPESKSSKSKKDDKEPKAEA